MSDRSRLTPVLPLPSVPRAQIKYLVNHGADVTSVDLRGRNAALYAAEAGHLRVLQYLTLQDPSLARAVTAEGKTARSYIYVPWLFFCPSSGAFYAR